MKFNVVIDEQTFTGAYTGKTCRLFREQFGKDLLLTLSEATEKMITAFGKHPNLEIDESLDKEVADMMQLINLQGIAINAIGPETLEKITWAVLAAENRIPLYSEWLDNIEDYPALLTTGVNVVLSMNGANNTTVDPVGKSEDSKKK